MDETLDKIERFHGHLGPYVVLGYRMGLICNRIFGNNPFSKKAKVYTGTIPPISCMIDGIQMSSGCTLGKGNIQVLCENTPRVLFSNKKNDKIEILLREEIQRDIDTNVTQENMKEYSKNLFRKPDEELFSISVDL
jgi:formylmethanofuran dehydrogenase subunit E